MTIAANGQTLTTRHAYRTAKAKSLPKWQRNRLVVFLRTAEMPSFGEVAVVQPVGEKGEFAIPAALLSKVN